MLQCPFDKTQFLQDILDVFNVITIYINIPIPANKRMQYSKQKCSIPIFISAIFLWSNAVCFCRTISLCANLFGTESASRMRSEIQLLCMTCDCHEVKTEMVTQLNAECGEPLHPTSVCIYNAMLLYRPSGLF